MTPDEKPPPRTLTFETWDDVLAELERIEASSRAGAVRLAGTWSVGQNCEHVARIMGWFFDGFPMKPLPAPVRLVFRLTVKRRMLKGFPRGLNPPGRFRQMTAPAPVNDAEGLRLLRAQIARFQCGEVARHPSPMLGALTPDEIVRLHLNHAAHHLGFIVPDDRG